MVSRAILYNTVLQFMSHLVFSFKNINKTVYKTFWIKRKIRNKQGAIRRKTHVSWLLKNLENYNWHQMITRSMFCNRVISYFCCMDITEIFINKRKLNEKLHQTKSVISQLQIS